MFVATSNVCLNCSLSNTSSQPNSHGTMIRCPDDEIGRNSVTPWTRPRTNAWKPVTGVHATGRPPVHPRPAEGRAVSSNRAGSVAQRIEQQASNLPVGGSIPSGPVNGLQRCPGRCSAPGLVPGQEDAVGKRPGLDQ